MGFLFVFAVWTRLEPTMLVGIARELFMTTPPNLPLIGEANGGASSIYTFSPRLFAEDTSPAEAGAWGWVRFDIAFR